MIFSFIEEHAEQWPVSVMCQTLDVSAQGFYAWRQRPTSQQQLRRAALVVEIRDAHAECKQRYGSPRIHAELVKGRRRFPDEGLLAHSDRGSQYASDHYQRLLARHGIECSMSEPGQCWDNAPMESFFATLKKELVHHEDRVVLPCNWASDQFQMKWTGAHRSATMKSA